MKEINKKIKKIWKEFEGEKYVERKPFLMDTHEINPDILFIGINPGLDKKIIDFSEAKLIEYDKEIKGNRKENALSYFKPFYHFSNNWEHMDVFFIRETKQEVVKELIGCKKQLDFNEFARKQLELFLPRINLIKPKIIIVNNAFASDIIKKEFSELIDIGNFNKEGFDRFKLNNRSVPIFFTGMLSGQRALDRESRRRLIWQVKGILGG